MELSIEEIEKLASLYPGDISVYECVEGRLECLYFSDGIPALSGMTHDEYAEVIARDAADIVLECDRDIVAAELGKALGRTGTSDVSYRILNKDSGSIWVHAKARQVGERNGHPVLLAAFLDTSLETELHEDLLDQVEECVHVCDASTHELLYLNETERATWKCAGDFSGKVCHDFLHGCGDVCAWCDLDAEGPSELHVDEMHDTQTDRFFRCDRRRVTWHGRDAFAVFSTDITESYKARRNLKDANSLLEGIIEHIPAGVCAFRVEGGRASLVAANEYLRTILDTSAQSLANLEGDPIIRRVHPDDRNGAYRATKCLMEGSASATCDFRIKDEDSESYRWVCLDGRSMASDNGTVLVFAAVTDITVRKLEEERYHNTVRDLLSANPQALCAFELNLTKNTCDGGRGASDYVQAMVSSDTAEGVFTNLGKLVAESDDLARCRDIFNTKSLLSAFEAGQDHFSVDYPRRGADGSTIWARTYISMVRNPSTSDVEAVVYSEDIDERRRKDRAIRIVTQNSYDYIALIDVESKTITVQDMGAQVPDHFQEAYRDSSIPHDFERARQYTADNWIYPADREAFLEQSTIDAIVTGMKGDGFYEYGIRGLRGANNVRRKRVNHAYLDNSNDTIVVWQTDITDAFIREQQDAERLEVALAAAKQASNAKTVFLSRMSHEIRTPMNAIIGMDALAAQAIGDDERVSDCLSKIGISSRYLLSLINDILDMSRIESGKMLLKNESFLIRDLVTSVDDLIVGQTEAKGLDYECIVANEVVDAYVGDSMKLQQVLVNMLGNAVKFTDRGKVTLAVQQVWRHSDQAKIRFVVSDTGRGIPDKDIKRIFDPFEQGDDSTTTSFGGTGLGLAITKSLVELMGGTIRARSIEGVGSEFIVEVPLTVDESVVGTPRISYHFEKMNTLVVDDDLVVCEQAKAILDDIGMAGEWVTSGAEAVQKVRDLNASRKNYDFILIDWKMPQMDGIETTRQIRRIVGPDVTIIIISAYDWQSIEIEAKAAGANLLVSKPLFKSTLVSAFQKAQSHVEDERLAAEEDFDFTGKRVLLAEDNAMNAEIAQCLLESKGFSVDLAHDGLEALEMFTQSEPGYYDVILMDVRMPHMDGLQASANIRRWKKPDAKTIPIVAMTANAFDEDVEKSKAAGMNAHLTKPIEPEIMFRALRRILGGEDEK